ncbi:MAG: hypothetical protein H6672_05635 [Anaerolineaceae bacterium]|nr:hypothetical protein [Anaerolineaceae bacterium]
MSRENDMRIPDRTRKIIGVVIIVLAMALLFVVALSGTPPTVEDTTIVSPTLSATILDSGVQALGTATPPYDATLYAVRQQQLYFIAASYGPTEGAVFSATEAALIATAQGTTTPLPTPTWGNGTAGLSGVNAAGTLAAAGFMGTAEAAALPTAQYMECGWQWATQPLPELTAQIAAALAEAGITDAAVRAKAFGENCVPQRENVAGYFATMETDFDITLTVTDTGDDAEIGSRLAGILDVLALFPPDETPGPNPGYITLIVSGPEDAQRIQRFLVTDAADARDQGLTGADLLAALNTGN